MIALSAVFTNILDMIMMKFRLILEYLDCLTIRAAIIWDFFIMNNVSGYVPYNRILVSAALVSIAFHKQQTTLVATIPSLEHQFVVIGCCAASFSWSYNLVITWPSLAVIWSSWLKTSLIMNCMKMNISKLSESSGCILARTHNSYILICNIYHILEGKGAW